MFENKKFLSIIIAQTAMPWVIAILGIFDVYFFNASSRYYREKLMAESEHADRIFMTLYRITLIYGGVLIVALLILGLIAFFAMIINLLKIKTRKKYSVTRPFVIWIYSGACIVGTLLLILLVAGFTYGQSV